MIKLIIICLNVDSGDTSDFSFLDDTINYLQRSNYKIYGLYKTDESSKITHETIEKKFDKLVVYEDGYKSCKKILYDIVIDSDYKLKEILVISSEYNMLKVCKDIYANSYYINTNQLTINNIMETIRYYEDYNTGILKKTAFKKNLNIVIPMAGNGIRFLTNPRDTTPKLLRDIFEKPVISWVLNNIRIDANYIFILKETPYTIRLHDILRSMVPNCKIIITKTLTQGSACSILLAENIINNSTPLLVANDNQWLDWDPEEFVLDFLIKENPSKIKLATFISNGSNRFKYVQLDENNNIVYVRHDKPISPFAITGISIWRHGEDFIRCAHKMISYNKRIKGEFCSDLITNEMLDEIKQLNITKNNKEISDKEISKENLDKEKSCNLVIKKEYDFFISLQDHDDIYNFQHYLKHQNSF